MKFEKKIENCSEIISNSCEVRDCQLQVYKIGDDIIYSGGLCPKGNTDTSTRSAPNYVEMYKKILNRYLAKFSINTEEESNKFRERVLIPRSLTFLNEKGVFFAAVYNALGFDIIISPESDDEIANDGINYAHSETCYPIKLAHGHVAYLKKHLRKAKDKMLFINAISATKEKFKFCPYVGGAGFLVKDALDVSLEDSLLPVFYFEDNEYKIEDCIYKDLKRVFKKRFKKSQVLKAVKQAEKAQQEFLEEIYSKGEKIIQSLKKRNEPIFIGVGRGYTVLDDKASSKVHELFVAHGLHFIPSFFIITPDYDITDIALNMYWYQGQSMIKYTLMAALDEKMYPVRETNFNCGTDSILLVHEEDLINKAEKPHLILQTDGHNSNAQFGTRTLANYEVVKTHKPKQHTIEDFKTENPPMDLEKRLIGIPYIGDVSYIMAASFRALGYQSEVVPTQTKQAQELARKYVSTNTCLPFNFQVGDQLAWLFSLKEKGIDPNKGAAIFEPKSKGPCRFGQYSIMLRKIFDEVGFDKVSIVDPNDDKDYTNLPLSNSDVTKLSKLFYSGAFCSDLLVDAMLRTRSYEKESGSSDKVYDELRAELYSLVEKEYTIKQLAKFMKKARKRFEELLDKDKPRKPIVVLNGEIFVRCHPKANQYSIKLLEKYGLEVILNMFSQWLDYVNKSNIFLAKERKKWGRLIPSLIKKRFMRNVITSLFNPFAEYLKGREPHKPEHAIEAVQENFLYERRIEGESPLSIGEAYQLLKGQLHGIHGIYHVGPFGCMQETAATSKIQAMIQQHRAHVTSPEEKIVPFMDAVFGESELSNLEAEIAAFAEKCYLKKKILDK